MAGWGKNCVDVQDLFLCECGSSEHQFILQLFDWGKDEKYIEQNPEENLTFTMSVHLSTQGFWNRLVRGVKYIFGYKCRYGDWDEIILTYADAQRLIDGMTLYRSKVNGYRKKLGTNQFNEEDRWYGP